VEDGARDLTAPVAVIGGGYAGCAAAITLAEAGVRVLLLEAGAVLGGRARRVVRDGLPLDNGQHLLLGAYRATLGILARLPGGYVTTDLLRRPLTVVPFGAAQPEALTLVAPRAPGRLGLAVALLSARGLTWHERLANLRFLRALAQGGYQRPRAERVSKLLAPLPPRVVRQLWEPLCLAALNTPIRQASAQIFANVIREAFGAGGGASDMLVAATDLSALLPERVATDLRQRGSEVRLQATAQVAAHGRDGVTLVVRGAAVRVAATIVAVGPHQLRHAFAPEALDAHPPLAAAVDVVDGLAFEPIVTVWLGYTRRAAMRAPLARLDDTPGQWVFDRPDILARRTAGTPAPFAQLLSVVISASGPHLGWPHERVVRAADEQLRRLQPARGAAVWSCVIAEKRATYACTPDRVRLPGPRLSPGLYVAGDYVDAEFPATLEAAVRSGIAAAEALLADRRQAAD